MIKPLSTGGKLFFALVNLGAILWLCVLWKVAQSPEALPWSYLALLILALASGFTSVQIPGFNSLISLSDTFVFSAILFFGPAPAALLAGTEGFLSTRRHTGRLLSAVSSLSVLTVSAWTAGMVYERVLGIVWTGGPGGTPTFADLIVPVGCMALVHYGINSWLVAALTSVARRLPLVQTWKDHYLWTSLSFFAGAFAAALGYTLIRSLGIAAFLVVVTIFAITLLTYKTWMGRVEEKNRHIERMSQVHLDTIEALAMAIDAKGQMASGHLRRVQAYAVGLGRLAGVDDLTVEAVRAAALLHDVGKLAVPDYILNKPGPLTDVERMKLRTYPRIGAEILSHVTFPYPVIPIVRHHQERWDGSGYPDGLAGEAIPIGARILSIADAADAMLCERAYRAAVPREDMIDYVRGEAGAHFDPALIELFCGHIEELDAAAEGIELPGGIGMEEIATIHREHAASLWEEKASRAPEPAPEGRRSVLSDISAARREGQALFDLVRDLNSTTSLDLDQTLELIMEKVRSLISFDTGSIYLLEEKTGLVIPAIASGLNADVIRRKSFRRGEGITGWVVDNGNTMINVQPELDFYGADIETGRRYRSALVMPLVHAQGCIGTITLYDRRDKHFGPEDERILERVVPEATESIQKARSYQESRDRAMTDQLTGLPNSRWLYLQLEQEMSRARRNGRPLVVVVMDLDRFKPINDTFGHHVGDEVLRQVADCLRLHFRGMDSVCRWAGDEFVVLLPESDPQFIETSILRVQQVIETTFVPTSTGRSVQVGVSAGWAVFPQDGEGFEELMRVADKRMYRNKTERHESGQTASA